MDAGEVIQALMAVVMTGFGWFLHMMWGSIKDNAQETKNNKDKINEIQVLVAGEYVRKDYFDEKIDRMFDKLDELTRQMAHRREAD